MDLNGATALVTGAAHRVGKAIALGLAGAGADIVLHSYSSGEAARPPPRRSEALGVKVALVSGDLGVDPAAILDGAGDLAPVQVLVNSAAVFPDDRLTDVTAQAWNRTLAINLTAPVFLTQAFAARLPATSRE